MMSGILSGGSRSGFLSRLLSCLLPCLLPFSPGFAADDKAEAKSEAKPAAVHFVAQAAPAANQALLYVYRTDSYVLDEYGISIYLNGKRTFEIGRNTYSWTYLNPGSYEVKHKWPLEVPVGRDTRIKLEAEGGKTYFVRFDAYQVPTLHTHQPSWNLKLMDNQSALQEMQGMHAKPPR